MNIPEQFFKDNPLPKTTAAALIIFQMDILFNKELNTEIEKATDQIMPESRQEEIRADAELTAATKTPEEIINRMRKWDTPNREAVCAKALEIEDEIMPEVIRRLKRSAYDNYIETAVIALSRTKESYIDQILEEFDEIRNPYAMSACCVLMAYRNRFDALPVIMKTYESLRKRPEQEDRKCSEGALYAIYSLTRHPA